MPQKWMVFQAAVVVVLLIVCLFVQNGWCAGMVVGGALVLGFGVLSWWLDENLPR